MICERKICTGCFACYNICPRYAINMVEDEYGYIYPKINIEKCSNCKLCEKICPALNPIEKKYPLSCYAVAIKDNAKRAESSSGGAATIFSEYILSQNGVVYGATVKKGYSIEHIRIDNLNDLKLLKGSKYVHSYIKDMFNYVKADLLKNKKVLFIGTSCQIAGLKKYLIKDYDNLYTVDIICHGVPSQKYLKEEYNDSDIDSISFRDNNNYIIKIKSNGKIIKQEEFDNSPYYIMFMNGLICRENCFNCQYARPQRVSDITVGDFWGLSKESKMYAEREKGISVVLPITEKGIELFNICLTKFNYEERHIEEALNGNLQLRRATKKPKNYDKFKKIYLKRGFEQAYKSTNRLYHLKRKVKKNKIVYNVYKKLRGKNE